MSHPEPPDGVIVRATVHLAGLKLGEYAIVDPDDPYIAECLACEWLVVEPEGDEAA